MNKTKMDICTKCWGTGYVHGGDENSTWSKTCEDCHGIGFVRVPMTNADRIRAMSDGELTHMFSEMCRNALSCDECPMDGNCPGGSYDLHVWSKWLQQPAEGE